MGLSNREILEKLGFKKIYPRIPARTDLPKIVQLVNANCGANVEPISIYEKVFDYRWEYNEYTAYVYVVIARWKKFMVVLDWEGEYAIELPFTQYVTETISYKHFKEHEISG